MTQQIKVMLSSTTLDLPEHRAEAMKACLRQGMFPLMMENLPASDADAIAESLRLVDEANIYLGIFAHRYGHVPKENNPQRISISEMEYDRAVKHGLPRLIFFIHDDHNMKAADVEQGEGAERLKALKERIGITRVTNFFKSPEDLRGHIVNSLSHYRSECSGKSVPASVAASDIPAPPEPYIAHPYILLQTPTLIGRRAELDLFTEWVSDPQSNLFRARILNVVALGGLGKSALTWKWFNDLAPREMGQLAGRMWWSFQESDDFEDFITCALAYVTKQLKEDVRKYSLTERERQLRVNLDRHPFLLALDGLERLLIAHRRKADEPCVHAGGATEALAQPGCPASAQDEEHRLRKTADPRVGHFLRKLAGVHATRTLVSTRLYPADLETSVGAPLPGSDARHLSGLSDDDAVELWRTFKITGSAESLLNMSHAFDKHPLLIQALAGVVAKYRHKPGNFDLWLGANPCFDPFGPELKQPQSQIFDLALSGICQKSLQILYFIAALHGPCTYDTLTTLQVGSGKPFADEASLIAALTDLEDRGLLGWDKDNTNRYDLHPVVRGVVLKGLGESNKKQIYEALDSYFKSLPRIDPEEVKTLEDIIPAVEHYYTLINLKRYEEATQLFHERLDQATLFRLNASRLRVKLLEALFPRGIRELPEVSDSGDQAYILSSLAATYLTSGQPELAAGIYKRNIAIRQARGDHQDVSATLGVLSNALRQTGKLREGEAAARQAFQLAREGEYQFLEAINLGWLGFSLAVRGRSRDGERALKQVLRIFKERSEAPPEETRDRRDTAAIATTYAILARISLWNGEANAARQMAIHAWKSAKVEEFKRYVVLAKRMLGVSALALNNQPRAHDYLQRALGDARAGNHVVEEILALVELAQLRLRQGDERAARELLEDVWESAEDGPYPLVHAEACNVLAQIERAEGNRERAVEAAVKAYRLAWCDGPPFSFYWELKAARTHLQELGAPEPKELPYDESLYEPMPKIELDLPDEFGGVRRLTL